MAVSFTLVDRTRTSNRFITVTKVTLDTDYAAGGYAVTAGNLGLAVIKAVLSTEYDGADTGFIPAWDATNSKLKVYYADYDAVADGVLIEAATDLDALDGDDVYVTALGI
jgi:hypothetical protein